jgi:tRNA (guanosine-2'-O-)-methyltransferase
MSVSERRERKFREVIERRQPDLTVVMENIHDPHNVSAVLRSCDAVGVFRVELLYTLEKLPRIGKKSSSSASKWIERRAHKSVDECYACLRKEGFAIYATTLGAKTISLHEADFVKPTALVFGNEHRGVSDEAVEKADARLVIPMMGMVQSLNVSVAAAVTLYEAMRQRISAGRYARPSFSEAEAASLLSDWCGR